MTETPTEDELRLRITAQLGRHPGREDDVQVWLGYLFALLEWGLISPSVHHRVAALLPPGDRRAINEATLGEYVDEHPEMLEPYQPERVKVA